MSDFTSVFSKTQYGAHERQVIGIWRNSDLNVTGRWVVFIHGGAWRDPRNTYEDGEHLANGLLDGQISRSMDGVASIDYRLSPDVKHPSHIEDILLALKFITASFEVSEYILVGHSAGAFLSFQVLTQWPALNNTAKISVTIGVEGIYNLPYMIEEHSSYEGFVSEAFGNDPDDWEKASPIGTSFRWQRSKQDLVETAEVSLVTYDGTIVLVHSPEDELLGIDFQPKFAKKHLQLVTGNEVTVCEELARGSHDAVYVSDLLVTIVKKYIGLQLHNSCKT
ncbi:arylformamidase [Sugiyamaella lignohabitans]|uniref:Kynurenine formamidase n=1 Tax=Sugiyamaella lignohabitans TaxID=796027 RepID=A0A167D7X6_9ASCO|nr:arylformamidase [Sugiyamaella lignohabitans]ANB12590.1 arylformamidase [Sugiyamaella lignohabitans]